MRSIHRIVNAVGYRRIFPITDRHEQCQYCGIIGGWHSQISDDHVPALNVRIPGEFAQLIRKVIVRACMSCNSLAGDKPHMTFEERSMWLKMELVRRNQQLLKDFDVDPSLFDQPENKALNEREAEQLLLFSRLGFGLPAIGSLPEELDFVMANGLRLSEQLEQFMFPGKLDDPQSPEMDTPEQPEELEDQDWALTRQECINMLAAEISAHELPRFFSAKDYREWYSRNQGRANACDLPASLSDLFNDIDVLSTAATQLADVQQSTPIAKESDTVEIDCFDGPFHCSKKTFRALTDYCQEGLRLELESISALYVDRRLRTTHVATFWKWVKLHPNMHSKRDLRSTVEALGIDVGVLHHIFAVSPKPGYVTVSRSYEIALEAMGES